MIQCVIYLLLALKTLAKEVVFFAIGISHVWPYCTVSNSHDNPWWLVDLEEKRTITRVIIMTMSGGDCKFQ